ncbi:hypothetical protein KIW84_020601 [Lathyrus oleraceus]|uniref:Uncharacterized protein n=1 Tax=Pisum sativum TaxID=3888 RepID=A0A9D5B839_PEA|nr:hypothetical protein KIW84_020601 [Pisum sativum]
MLDFDWRTTNNCHQIQLCSSVIKSGYEFFDTYGNNGDIIALITLATGPFIVASGGISNIFLHRPARISRLEDEQEPNLVQIKEIGSTIQSFNSPSHAAEQSCYRPAPQPNELTNVTGHHILLHCQIPEDKFEKHGDASSEQCVRPATGSEGVASSNPQPPRLPTFPASALGPWQAVIAYDACARLWLPAWAMQCMEAPHVFIVFTAVKKT